MRYSGSPLAVEVVLSQWTVHRCDLVLQANQNYVSKFRLFLRMHILLIVDTYLVNSVHAPGDHADISEERHRQQFNKGVLNVK